MTEERLESTENQNKAVNIVRILIRFECPKDSSEVAGWLEQIRLLQALLSKLWQDDRTGRVMVECLNVLYDVIALNQIPVSPAVWSILDLVEDDKIHDIVEKILNDPNSNEDSKVQNALTAIVDGLCQYGPRAPKLQDWALAIVQGLETRKNFAILTAVAECTIVKLMRGLMMPFYRPLTYPVLRLFLCSVATPHVFHKIIDQVPRAVLHLEKERDDEDTRICLNDFSRLLRVLLVRFPPEPHQEMKYKTIKLALARLPEVTLSPESITAWDPDENRGLCNWTVQPILSSYELPPPSSPYKGLVNQGNTCFMNSVLQILYMTTRFRGEILEREPDPSERAATHLQQLFAFMQESNRNVLVPNGVMDSTLPPTFRRGHQQDSSEYLIYLLDTLHENENKIIRRRRQAGSPHKSPMSEKKVEGNGDYDEGAASFKNSNDDENTIVERLFGGTTTSTTVCSVCKGSFPKNDSFRDLHLSLPDDHKLCDLQELINVSLQPEELCSDNMYDCSSCGTKRNATRMQTIVKAPEHLILTLKLFRFDAVRKQRLKLHSRLKNAKTIELPVYNSSQLQTKVVMYDVKGVVLHSGNSDSGHYFSAAVDPSGQWYIFNDTIVSVAKCEWSAGGGTPYILVLRQSDLPDPPNVVLPSNLQLIVNRDNQKYLAERRYQQRVSDRKRDYDDDWDDTPPSNGSLGGPGPSLVF